MLQLAAAGAGLPYLMDAVAASHRRTLKGGVGVRDAWASFGTGLRTSRGRRQSPRRQYCDQGITRWKDFFEFPSLDNLDWDSSIASFGPWTGRTSLSWCSRPGACSSSAMR